MVPGQGRKKVLLDEVPLVAGLYKAGPGEAVSLEAPKKVGKTRAVSKKSAMKKVPSKDRRGAR